MWYSNWPDRIDGRHTVPQLGWFDTPVVSLVVRVHWFGFGGMEHRMNLTSHTTAAHFFDAPHKDTSTETT